MAASVGTSVEHEKGETELNSSELGTKEYWDSIYERDLNCFKDTGDVGEVWFGYDSNERLVTWLEESPLVSMDSSILDIGCGNGVLLTELCEAGFTQLTGADYSQGAVDLARAVTQSEEANIRYECCNVLAEPSNQASCLAQCYDVCLDKGTYDAICLNPESPAEQRAKYIKSIVRLLKDNSIFILTSCNWTEAELVEHFDKKLAFIGKIATPSFSFGGQTGNRETMLIFKKPSSKPS